jgi:hypothetical protein
VYDVSANRRVYGPGGGYGFFAGKDAARAFVTGCFKTDLTHDVRGLDPAQLEVATALVFVLKLEPTSLERFLCEARQVSLGWNGIFHVDFI